MRSDPNDVRRASALVLMVTGLVACGGGSPDTLPAPDVLSQTLPAGGPAATYVRPGGASATSAAPAAEPAGYQVVPDSLAWSPDGALLAYATRDGAFFLDDGSGGLKVEGAELGGVGRSFVRWSPLGDALLAGGAWFDGLAVFTGLWLVNVADGRAGAVAEVVPPSQVVSTVGGNTGAVHGADWSPDAVTFAYPYRGEAWLASAQTSPSRLTTLTDAPLERDGAATPFSGVRAVAFNEDGMALALELSCDCGSPWSGAALLEWADIGLNGAGSVMPAPVLIRDGMTVTGWSPDGRITGQNSLADWTPQATIDGYAVPGEKPSPGIGRFPEQPTPPAAENLTMSNPDVDPLTADAASLPVAPLQTGPVEWNYRRGPEYRGAAAAGAYLYEVYTYGDGPLPHRGFVTRSGPDEAPAEHIGSSAGWFVAPRWLSDGRLAYLEAEPGPAALMVLKRAIVEDGAELPLDGMASAVAFNPPGTRLAIVQSSIGGDDVVKIVETQ